MCRTTSAFHPNKAYCDALRAANVASITRTVAPRLITQRRASFSANIMSGGRPGVATAWCDDGAPDGVRLRHLSSVHFLLRNISSYLTFLTQNLLFALRSCGTCIRSCGTGPYLPFELFGAATVLGRAIALKIPLPSRRRAGTMVLDVVHADITHLNVHGCGDHHSPGSTRVNNATRRGWANLHRFHHFIVCYACLPFSHHSCRPYLW